MILSFDRDEVTDKILSSVHVPSYYQEAVRKLVFQLIENDKLFDPEWNDVNVFLPKNTRFKKLVPCFKGFLQRAIIPHLPSTTDEHLFFAPLSLSVSPQRFVRDVTSFIIDRANSPYITWSWFLEQGLLRVHSHRLTHRDFEAVFENTPFLEFLETSVPLHVSNADRFNHMHVVGGTGSGKTTLLEKLILHDLKGQASVVVVDSQGDLIRKISHLKRWKDDDRLVLITPKDTRFPPALNVFDLNKKRLGQYDEGTKEQVIAGVIQTFDYLFGSLLGADLTAKQSVFFRFVARLMLSLPETMGRNATILDMLHLMEDPAPYKQAIETLPPIQRHFFERDFKSKTFAQTKEQIRYRLHAIIENPTLARLFTSQSTKIDLFTELNRGSVILVDTAKDFLKGSSAHFGQVFISLILQAVLERAAIPENQRRPTFMFVDEAAEYFDQNIDDLLTEARKHKLGAVFAHQYLDQASHALRASFAANTGIKFASGISMSDARAMAPDMRTEPEFILSQPPLQFAAYIRGITQQAVSIPVKVGSFDNEPRLTEDEYKDLMRRNRDRVSLPHVDNPQSPPPEDEDVSETW